MIKFLSEPEYVNHRNKSPDLLALITNISVFSPRDPVLLFFGGHVFAGSWAERSLTVSLISNKGILVIIVLIPFNHLEVLLQAHFKFRSSFYGYLVQTGNFYDYADWLCFLYDKPGSDID